MLDKDYDAGSASGSIPLVILPTSSGNSWATAAGVFEATTRTFNARPGVTVEEDYVSRINNKVALQYNYAQLLIARDYYRVALGRE